jgi:phage shock protein E
MSTVTKVDGAAARKLVASGALLLDVRTPEEYASGHIAGATNLPVDDVRAKAGTLTKGNPVVVYCRSGHRSRMAAAALLQAGFQVYDLGAMSNW